MTETSLDTLTGFDVVLSGYWETADPPADAQKANETTADAVLYEMAAGLSEAGVSTDIHLTFGPGGEPARAHQNQLAAEVGADGILLADDLSSLLTLVVPLRDDRHQTEIVEFVSAFDPDSLFAVELFHVAADEAGVADGEALLQAVAETLWARGFTDADLDCTVVVSSDPKAAIADVARDNHLVVMGETQEPDVDEQLFGPVSRYVAEQSATPVAVVQDR